MDINELAAYSAGAEAGQWVQNIPNMPGVKLKVLGGSSAAYKRAREAKFRAIPASDRSPEGIPSAVALEAAAREAMHEVALLDWAGVTVNGEDFAYDREIARKLLDPRLTQLYLGIDHAMAVVDADKSATVDLFEKN